MCGCVCMLKSVVHVWVCLHAELVDWCCIDLKRSKVYL